MILLMLACHTPDWYDPRWTDLDEDGFSSKVDCDDLDVRVHPEAPEIWYDGIDQDCDGHDDDQDRDGYDRAEDCDDTNADAYPGAWEVWYDGVDQDCDGNDADQDGDGWPWPQDCDDLDPSTHPGAHEASDGIDQDCDGQVAQDHDQDGWPAELDCDDTHPGIHPGAEEIWYDGVDQDCDGWDDDQDGDGYPAAEDCDDTQFAARPGAPETCDGLDTDCDGRIDEGLTGPFVFREDRDGDGYGSTQVILSELCELPEGAAYTDGDCNDGDAAQSPDATEVCDNGVDDDCDGAAPGCGFDADPPELVSEGARAVVWLDGRQVTARDGRVETEGREIARGSVTGLVDLGDIDDDGWSDLGLSGAGHVLLGPLHDEPVELLSQIVDEVRPAGDVDGDGYDDVLSGGGLFYGPVQGDLASPDLSDDGRALVTLDTQGDGVAEILFADQDAAWLHYAAWGAVRAGDADWRRPAVRPIATAGDVDGDGYSDLLLGTSNRVELHLSPLLLDDEPERNLTLTAAAAQIELIDLYDDGRLELLAQQTDGATLLLLEDGHVAERVVLDAGLTEPIARGQEIWLLDADALQRVALHPRF